MGSPGNEKAAEGEIQGMVLPEPGPAEIPAGSTAPMPHDILMGELYSPVRAATELCLHRRGAFHGLLKFWHGEGLLQEQEGGVRSNVRGPLVLRCAAHHDHGKLWEFAAERFQRVETIHARHLVIENDCPQFVAMLADEAHAVAPLHGDKNFKADPTQNLGGEPAQLRFVLHNQNKSPGVPNFSHVSAPASADRKFHHPAIMRC